MRVVILHEQESEFIVPNNHHDEGMEIKSAPTVCLASKSQKDFKEVSSVELQQVVPSKPIPDSVKNLYNLEEELFKIDCALYITALRAAGFLSDEVISILLSLC